MAAAVVAAGTALAARTASAEESIPAPATPGAVDAFPVEVPNAFGTAVIPAQPQRVVTLGWADADVPLALGVVPVGVRQFTAAMERGVGRWAEDRLGDATPHVFEAGVDVDLEVLVGLDPDLITAVQTGADEEQYQTFTAIAPTLGLPVGATPNGVPWQTTTRTIATGLGYAAEGERLVAETEQLLADTAAAHPEYAGKTVSVLLAYNDKLGFWTTADTRVQLVSGIGLEPSAYIKDAGTGTFFEDISLERVADLEADAVIFLSYLASTLDELKDQYPVIATMQAVTEGRAIAIDDMDLNLGLSIASVLSIPFAVDGLTRKLAEIIPA
jgi:iron complex transport system substrate-binding protein